MFSQLTKYENDIILLFFEVFPSCKNALNDQVQNSDIRRANMNSSYFVDFNVSRHVAPVPCNIEVPVEIIVGEVSIPPAQILRRVNGHIVTKACSFFVQDQYAVGIQLHFKSGYLNELEVYSLAGKKLSQNCINGSEITYVLLS